MEIFIFFIRLGLAAIFAVAGIGKLLDLEGSEKAVKNFGVPEKSARTVSFLLPIAELAIALFLVFNQTSWFGAIGGTALLLVFIGGMIVQIKKGNAPDCHCFGQIHSEPVGPKSLIRNIIFLLASMLLVGAGRENQGFNLFENGSNFSSNTDFMQLIIGLAIIGLMGAIIYFLKQISDQQVKLMRRMDVLELLSQEGRDLVRDNIGHPEDGLPVGAHAPDFELPDTSGKLVEFEHLLAFQKPLLFFFVGPNCSPCGALMPEIEVWADELKDGFEFIFISSGLPKPNIEKFSFKTGPKILLQENREVATQFGAVWTPTALLVNSDGTIGSRIATGDTAIRELLVKIKAEDSGKDSFYIANGNGHLRKSKIGEKVPEFTIEDLTGRKIGTDDLHGKKTLVTFWSMTCPHCDNMLEELRDWDQRLDGPNLIVFSDGEADDHKQLGLNSPVLIEKDYKTAVKLGMVGTPSAVLVNENGVIVSETAVGGPQIRALIGKRK